MQQMFCEPLNSDGEPLAMFSVWVKNNEPPNPQTCYVDKNGKVFLADLDLSFPHQHWASTNFYEFDKHFTDCLDPDRCHYCLTGGPDLSHG